MEHLVINMTDKSVMLRARTSLGQPRATRIPSDSLPAAATRAIDDLVAAVTPHVPKEPETADLDRIATLEEELRVLRERVGVS